MFRHSASRILAATLVMNLFLADASATEFDNILASFGNLSTVAGRGATDGGNGANEWSAGMEGGLAVNAELSRPHMTMADAMGNFYIADKDAHGIRLVTLDGAIVTLAGTNTAGFNGDGPGVESQLNAPNGLYTFPDGTNYILDLSNSKIRRLGTDGQLVTIVDDPEGIGVGRGLWVSADESTIYYSSGGRIREWTADGGLRTYADGFLQLGNIDVDPLDGLLVASDRGRHVVEKILPDGTRFTIAGNGSTTGGGSGLAATTTGLNEVRGVFFDTTGGYYVGTHRDSDVWYVDTAGIIHMLILGDRNDNTHSGDGQPLTTSGDKISEPRAVTLAPDRDLIVTENDRGFVRHVPRIALAGDFDYDGALTAADIDLLTRVTLVETHPFIFNLNQSDSRFVDGEDRRIWVEDLFDTEFGDANLDGLVDETDFAIWDANKFTAGTTWGTGDFNGDGLTDVSDFNLWNANRGSDANAIAVPEPSTFVLYLSAFGLMIARGRRRS